MYLQSILYTVTEIREEIEQALNTECTILVMSHSKDMIEIEINLPKFNAKYSQTFSSVEIASEKQPSTAVTNLKNEAREFLAKVIIK